MTKQQENYIEMKYRAIVYSVLELAEQTKYTAVLAETGLPTIMSVINQNKINYMSFVLWDENARSQTREVLWQDFLLRPQKSMVAEVDNICVKLRLPKVSETPIDRKIVKDRITNEEMRQGWITNFKSRLVVNRHYLRGTKTYHVMPKSQARAVLIWRIGALRFRDNWFKYNNKRQGTGCVMRMCSGIDTLEHAMFECKFVKAKIKVDKEGKFGDEEIAEFIVQLNRERMKLNHAII